MYSHTIQTQQLITFRNQGRRMETSSITQSNIINITKIRFLDIKHWLLLFRIHLYITTIFL